MQKLLLTSAAAIIGIIGAANANIASDANSAECDNATLGVDHGATNLEAQWNANTITLKWYDGDTQFTPTNNAASGECTYDGALTVPSDTLSKTGYTFDGWTVRAAAIVPEQANCPEISIYDCNSTPGCRTDNGIPWPAGCFYYLSYCADATNEYICNNGITDCNFCTWENGQCITGRTTGDICQGEEVEFD